MVWVCVHAGIHRVPASGSSGGASIGVFGRWHWGGEHSGLLMAAAMPLASGFEDVAPRVPKEVADAPWLRFIGWAKKGDHV